MGTLSTVYNISRNIIGGAIILRYVNTSQTPNCDMSYKPDGPTTTRPKKYRICHITNLKTLSHINLSIAI